MLAVEELLGLEPAGGDYEALSGPKAPPRGLLSDDFRDELGSDFARNDWKDGEEFRTHLDHARRTAAELIARIRSGDVRPCPDSCAWGDRGCSYPSICREEG
jgi:hypothetical protein